MVIFDLRDGQVSEYLVDDSIQIEERREVFRYYGTCTKTLLTMFEAVHFFQVGFNMFWSIHMEPSLLQEPPAIPPASGPVA